MRNRHTGLMLPETYSNSIANFEETKKKLTHFWLQIGKYNFKIDRDGALGSP